MVFMGIWLRTTLSGLPCRVFGEFGDLLYTATHDMLMKFSSWIHGAISGNVGRTADWNYPT